MPLLEDRFSAALSKQDNILQHFENVLLELLHQHMQYKKKIEKLTEENKTLKNLLEISKNKLRFTNSPIDKGTKKALPIDNVDLIHQLNAYIKEIDYCLRYFDQI